MRKTGSSVLDDINIYDNDNTEYASEEFIDYVSPEEETIIKDLTDENEQEQPKEDKNIDDQPILNDWLFAFKDIPTDNSLKIEDRGQTYIYKRVLNPDGSPTKKFNGFYKGRDNTAWISLNGVLTDRYVASSLDKFVNSVLMRRINLTHIPIADSKEPWKTVWFGISNLDVAYIEVPTEATYIFESISESDITINRISSKLGFSVSNTYDGSNKLKVSPIVRTVGLNGIRPLTSFVDYFTFCNFTHDISHTSDASGFDVDLTTIQENVSDHLVVLKSYTDVGSVIEDISKSFKKASREKFKKVCSSIQLDMNLFHVLMATSIALGKYYSIAEHLAIRSKFRRLFERIF